MPRLPDLLDAIWHTHNSQMAWGRLPIGHTIGAKTPAAFVPNDDYVVIKLGSMFLRDSRVLWLKLSPLAHAIVTLAGRTAPRAETAVIGPAQFGDLATAPADRSVVLNQRLAGPAVWRGGDLVVAAGLFAVPKDESAAALLDTLGQLAALAIPGLKPELALAGVVKSGVEGLIGLKGTKPVLGVKDSLGDPSTAPAGTEAAPCTLVGIAAAAAGIDFSRFWVREGRLWEGPAADALTPYEQHDHFIVTVERGPARQDWRGLPKLAPHEAAFDSVLRASDMTKDAVAARLDEVFFHLDEDLSAEADLTEPDKARIRSEVIAELHKRVERKFAGPFAAHTETRSVGGIRRQIDPDGFNFLDVGDAGPEGAKPVAAGTRPFLRAAAS